MRENVFITKTEAVDDIAETPTILKVVDKIQIEADKDDTV